MTGQVDPELRAVDGRVPGRRGMQTRQRLLDQTLALLEETTFRELKVVDIAREAGTSPATFYQYFPGVEEAILALAEEMSFQGGDTLVDLPGSDAWSKGDGERRAAEISESFIQFWRDNQAIMRVIDLTAEEGDTRFRAIRTRLLNAFNNQLVGVIEAEKKAGNHPKGLSAEATAGVMVSMLSNVASHHYVFEQFGVEVDDLSKSMARVLYLGVTGSGSA